ncbi:MULTISPECIES: hydroxymethylglutaryl-CoA synthase [unclassified Granulicatella]|uniref:hydroxymethylglutaryl-CoA synthase n=1 Tax=unclassified Granulicatella TaxID=2630493 RepID=UPI00107487E0|nr:MULTISPECIES: hydroxymethylglutaryl-CoA synthase [unclassified Granulicatella]MBF0780496.1 hydroxymethylglutaryl-CoA synthase [Granulicatella sp. 19428wC4_WM01]TFU95354.1 hydroxymethylglutaryl-CoA synthase [Granulicatella sp. WM01]
MKIGIDKMGFYTPDVYIDMIELANARGIDSGKYTIGLGQEKMAVAPIYEDAVTMAANAALSIVDNEDREQIDLILVGSESGVDQSKSIAIYVQSLVGMKRRVRAVELKQACYGATMGLQIAREHILANPDSKVLVIATDIAKYGVNTPGEPTQGAGAVAMLLSKNPRIAEIEPEHTFYTEDIMDFWRPVYSDTAFADGKFSTEKYIEFFETVWCDYTQSSGKTFADFTAICFHMPFTKLGYKALTHVLDKYSVDETDKTRLLTMYEYSKSYNKQIGNIYTGSLYLSLMSLLEHSTQKRGNRIGLFSYGSGAIGEFFTIKLRSGFKKHLHHAQHKALLDNRVALSIDEYERILNMSLAKDGTYFDTQAPMTKGKVVLSHVENHQRVYRHNS